MKSSGREQLQAHNLADLFPMMDNADFANLKADMQASGYDPDQPIILYENKILDGRNRYKASQELGIKPTYRQYDGDSPLDYVMRTNLNRRHLNQSQKAVIALEVLPLYEVEARRRQLATLPQKGEKGFNVPLQIEEHKGEAAEKVGQQLGVSRA